MSIDIRTNYSGTWIAFALADFGNAIGHLDEAEYYADMTLKNFTAMHVPRGRLKCSVTLADIHRNKRETDKAQQLYEECLQDPYAQLDGEVVVNCLHGLAKLNLAEGDARAAVEQLAGAHAIVKRTPLVIRQMERQKLRATIDKACAQLKDPALCAHWELGTAYWSRRAAESVRVDVGTGTQ